jgi:hypothetical protein
MPVSALRRTPATPFTYLRPLALVILSAFVAGSAQANSFQDLAARLEKRLDLNLYKLGQEVQLGRECGIPDTQMPEHLADYDALVEANNAVLHGTTLTPTEKAPLAPAADANAAFLEGAKSMVRIRPLIHRMGCADILKEWSQKEAVRAGQAKTWHALAERAKAGHKG